MSVPILKPQLPVAAKPVFEGEARYRCAWGGRGSAKSHTFASVAVLRGRAKPLRFLCAREIQNSIKESVKKLLDDKIRAYGLGGFYRSTESGIEGANGTQFIFTGLRNNADSVKSMEGIDVCWVEEAQTVSLSSLSTLTPTIRKPGSEIWFTWNPRFPTDPVDRMFRGSNGAPPRTRIAKLNYDQNPFFPDVLREEMEWDKRVDPDKYAHVWLGEYLKNSEARVFKNWKIEDFETPADVEVFYFGADWGFAVDPTVLVRCFIVGRRLYVDREAYSVGCEIDSTPFLFAGGEDAELNPRRWEGIPGARKWPIIADSARPETISYMKRKGFKMVPAIKGVGSVEEGINFLKNYEIVVHPSCIHTIDELTLYSYKIDKLTGMVLPVLEDKKNHVIDALRYAVEKLRRALPGENLREFYRQEAERVMAQAAAASAVVSQSDRIGAYPPDDCWVAYGRSGGEYRRDENGIMWLLPEDANLASKMGWRLA